MQAVLKTLSYTCAAPFALSFAGAILPMGDSLAVFRVPLATLFALCVIWTDWPRRVRWPLALIALAAIAHIALPRWWADDVADPDVTLYQQNLLFNRDETQSWLSEIAQRRPDIITLQEVSGRNMPLYQALQGAYPAHVFCPFASVGGVAVLSRFPAAEGQSHCAPERGLAAIRVNTPHGPLWAGSLHLHWPWPFDQAAQVDALMQDLAQLDGNVILGGDFNAVGWSWTTRRIARAIRGRRVPHPQASFVLPNIAMPVAIDHVLTNLGAGSAISLPRHGSDHFGVFAKVHFKDD